MSKKKSTENHKNKNSEEPIVEETENFDAEASNEKVDSEDIDDEKAEVSADETIDPIEELQKQLDESKDKYVRLSAEFDNYRKRTQREKMDLIRFGSEDVIKGILPLIDDFERALNVSQKATDIEAMKQGLSLIHGKFTEFLKSNSVKEIEALGKELDTDVHEAITKIPVEEKEKKGKIVDVVEKGYKLNDKVIRFAKVVVGE